MKKLKIYFVIAATMLSSVAMAQSIEDMYRISFKSREFGSARSMGMGGAFTSLGADISSVGLNPAGIGMYRSSEMVFTPSLVTSNTISDVFDTRDNDSLYDSFKNRTTNLVSNNLAAVLNLYRSNSSIVKALNVAVSLETTLSRKYSSYVESPSSNVSIGDYFAGNLYGISPNEIDNSMMDNKFAVYNSMSPGLWGSMMAYNTNFVSVWSGSNPPSYGIDGRALTIDDLVNPQQAITEHLTKNNTSFTFGGNFGDKLYLGVSVGVTSFLLQRVVNYQEYGVQGNVGDLENLTYITQNNLSSSAFDFKIGATLEPVKGVRLGVAYHAPSLLTDPIYDEYYEDMYTSYTNGDKFSEKSPYSVSEYDLSTPASLLAGISYAFSKGIISFDYQRTWYNKMTIDNIYFADDMNKEIAAAFRPTDSYMVGLELKPIDGIYLRGGYAYYSSPYLDERDRDYGSQTSLSFGLGYRYQNFGVDLAYMRSSYKILPSYYYSGWFVNPNDPNNANADILVQSTSYVEQSYKNSIVALTFLYRF